MTRGDQHKPSPSIAEMEREIARTREQLGETIEELAARADVPARAKAKASDTAARVRATFHRNQDRAKSGAVSGASTAQAAARDARDQAADRALEARERAAVKAGEAKERAAAKAGEAKERAAEAAHDAATRAGAKAGRMSEDQARTLYAVAAVSLTAATVVAIMWARQHGDFDRSRASSWYRYRYLR